MQCKVIEAYGANPMIYLNGALVCSDKYVYVETEVHPAMMGYSGVYTQESIAFPNLVLLHGDDLIIVYPNRRYEYPIYKAIAAGTVIDLRPDPVTAEEPST